MWICIAPRRDHTSKALRHGTCSQGISQFYLHTLRTSANGINHTCPCLPSRSWYSLTDPGGMDGWVGLGLYSMIHSKQETPVFINCIECNITSRWMCMSTIGNWAFLVWNGLLQHVTLRHTSECTSSLFKYCFLWQFLSRQWRIQGGGTGPCPPQSSKIFFLKYAF